jgi:hypothetical protein
MAMLVMAMLVMVVPVMVMVFMIVLGFLAQPVAHVGRLGGGVVEAAIEQGGDAGLANVEQFRARIEAAQP